MMLLRYTLEGEINQLEKGSMGILNHPYLLFKRLLDFLGFALKTLHFSCKKFLELFS